VSCEECSAVCCRLTVIVEPEDGIDPALTHVTDTGLRVMARAADGWCVAMDRGAMQCSIYTARPDACRRFHMGGPYCRAVREDFARGGMRGIPLNLKGDAS
jgi:Fe-S-cluster containining protein